MKNIIEKLNKIAVWSAPHTRCAVAFSGGVDSSFLISALKRNTNLEIIAFTVATPYVPERFILEAKEYLIREKVEHIMIPMEIPVNIRKNPPDRCYLCKKRIFTEVTEMAEPLGIRLIVDGSNADDLPEERPGMRALSELKIYSPLREAGLTKADIRQLSRSWNLSVAEKPAYSCLLTRLPANTTVETSMLKRMEAAEQYLYKLGFCAVRIRPENKTAIIEAAPHIMNRLSAPEIKKELETSFIEYGFRSIKLEINNKWRQT